MGQHKFNPVARQAREGKLPPKPKKMSTADTRRLIYRALEKATGLDRLRMAVHGYLPEEPPRKVKGWEELDGLLSVDGRYKIKVELEDGCGHILPNFKVQDSEWWEHYAYLSTHTFYEGGYKDYTALLQRFGFNVELVSWG